MLHSTASLILYSVIAFIVGFLLKFILGRAGKTDYKSMFETADTENKEASKNLARAQKSLDKSHVERDNWKTKFEELKQTVNSGQSEGKLELQKMKAQILEAQKETSTVQAEKERSDTRYERLKNDYESYKRKMQVEKDAIKGYKTELEKLRKDHVEHTATIEKLNRQNGEMKLSLEKQFQKMGEINDMSSKMRRLRAKNIKIQTDLEYWEKKHFETHHELAKLKKSLEQA